MQKTRKNIKKYISFFLAFGLFIGSFNISNAMDDTVITGDEVISEEEVLIEENNESKLNEEVVTFENNIETDAELNDETFVSDSIEEEILEELEEKEIISDELDEITSNLEQNNKVSNEDLLESEQRRENLNEEDNLSKIEEKVEVKENIILQEDIINNNDVIIPVNTLSVQNENLTTEIESNKPSKPTIDDMPATNQNGYVYVKCVTYPNSNPLKSSSRIHSGYINIKKVVMNANYVSFSDVYENDGRFGSYAPIADYPWFCDLIVDQINLLNLYNANYSKQDGIHYLANPNDIIRITFISDGNEWYFFTEDFPITVWTTHKHIPIPTPTYKVIYKDGTDGLVFGDEIHENLKENDKTPEFQGTLTRDGHTFMGWAPSINPIVNAEDANANNEIIYTATWMKEKPITITKEASEEYPYIGEEFEYTIKITSENNSNVIVDVIDKLPQELEFVRVSESDEGVYDEKTHSVTWNNLSISKGTKELIIWVKANKLGEIRNEAKLILPDGNSTSANATIEAIEKILKVSWYDEDKNTKLDTNTFKQTEQEPSYSKELPTKESDENYTYKFLQWVKQDIPLNDDDISYVAEYEKIPIKYGSYQIKHEYYAKDKTDNLTLENTVSENVISNVVADTVIEADNINQIPENNGKIYTFSEHTGNITIEENITKEITIKYVRDKEYGSYKVKHEYYTKDKDGNMSLDKTNTEEAVLLETGTVLDTSTIELKPEQYTYSEISDKTVTIETDVEKIITIKYVKEEKCGSYQIKHEYYVKDKENNLTLENTVSENIVSNVIVGTIIEADKLNQIPENNGKSYTFLEHTGNIIIEENVTKEITIKYVRDKEYGSYKVKHNYYVKDKNGNFILEETVLEDSVLVEPNVSIGLKDADIIIFQKLRDGYKFKDSSERMTIQANKEIEFVINYFREDSVIIEYGNYQVIHQYYLDDKLESTITEDTVSNIKVGTSIGVVDSDILVSKKLNHNNKNYEFVSANKVVIESNKTATLIIKYVRKTEPTIPEEVKPVSVSIIAKKKLENGSLKDKQFSFRLTNGVVTYIAENDSYGNINFNPLTFDTEGTYKFTLSEDNTNESNIKYDSSKYEVEIVVSKVGNSLTASVKYFKDGKEFSEINFINKYEIPKEEKPTETPHVDNKPTNNNPNDKPNTSTSDLIEISDNEVPQSAPITGDSSHILLFMFLFIVSGFCLIILKKRKS